MQIKSSALDHEPTSLAVLLQRLGKRTQSIAKETPNGGGWHDTPACFFDDDNSGSLAHGEAFGQLLASVLPLLVV